MGVVKGGYGRSSNGGVKSSKQATRYAANRKGQEQNWGGREIYDRDGVVSKDEAYRKIEAADQGGDKYHYRLTLSHAQTGEGVDHNATTRETMQRLEERHAAQGGAVTWHAVNHMDHTRHEHTHVVAVTDRRIGTADFANMRAELDRSYERHTPRDMERVEQVRSQEQRQEVQMQATPEPQREEAQAIPEPQRPQAEPAQEQQEPQQRAVPEPSAEQPERQQPQRQLELDWIYTEEQQRDERYLAERPSLITSGEAAREYDQYKQLEATLQPLERRELHTREMEWAREQRESGQRPELNQAYWQDHGAVIEDLRQSRGMTEGGRQRYMDSQADNRWMHRAVNERGLQGEALIQGYKERQELRRDERAAQEPQRQTRWGENRRQHNAEQAQRHERQAQAWAERPARTPRQQQRQDQQQEQSRGGRER